jgi:cyanophycin synthetase
MSTAAITQWAPDVRRDWGSMTVDHSSVAELRVLEGPNLYFPRAAVKLTLDLASVLELSESDALRLAARIGLRNVRPGAAGSGFRQRFAARAVARLVRQIAAEAGTHRLALRVRATADVHQIVVAYPWRRRGRAEALGRAVGFVLDSLPRAEVEAVVSEAAARVRSAEEGDPPRTIRPKVPVVAVTGTNGKTTTSRMIAHMARCAGLHVGWSSTDGIYVDGTLVESGDYSGPSGAGRVLAQPGIEFAVTETARGGILLRGIGVTSNDVSVVTNVSADHLGMQGIDTVDQLAEVKAVVARITKPGGWAVLNAQDPRVLAMRSVIKARPWVFSRDPDAPGVRQVLGESGRATTIIDGWISVLDPGSDPNPLQTVVDVPMTLSGLSHFNVENALAAASAGLAAGLEIAAVVRGLTSFEPGPELNPGRMNIYSLGDVTVVIDLAHNEAGLEALLEIMSGLCPPVGRRLLVLGTAGDRTDDIVRGLGEVGARGSDVVVVAHKLDYMRGRSVPEMTELYREGARVVGVEDVPSYDTELQALQALMAQSRPHDVVAVMCHQDRPLVEEWLRSQGATADDAPTIRRKVLAAGVS